MKLPLRENNQPSTPNSALRTPHSDEPGEELDRALARQMSEGSQEALVRFIDRHIGYLYKHLQRRLGPGHDALIEGVVKSTFETASRRMRPYVRGYARTPMRLWLLRLAGRDLARRKAIVQPTSEGVESEEFTELREAVSSLPRKQQAAVCMALFEGMSAAEMSGALGVRQATAMRLLRRGLKRTGTRLSLAHAEVS